MRALLAGPVRQVCWLLAGRFALRSGGIVIGGRAVALTGNAPNGKSAVTATLAARGHDVLSDGALPIRSGPPAVAEPADAAVHLWPDVAELLSLGEGELIRPDLAKRRHVFAAAPAAPLAAVVVLHRTPAVAGVDVRPARGWDVTELLLAFTAMRPVLAALGLAAAHLGWAAALASRVPVVHVRAEPRRDNLDAVADAVASVVSERS